jgi:hypothetical protein
MAQGPCGIAKALLHALARFIKSTLPALKQYLRQKNIKGISIA